MCADEVRTSWGRGGLQPPGPGVGYVVEMDDLAVDVGGGGHAAAGEADSGRAPGERLDQRGGAVAAAGEEAGEQRVARADAAAAGDDLGLADGDALLVDQHGAVGAEAGQYRSSPPRAQFLGGVDRVAQ